MITFGSVSVWPHLLGYLKSESGALPEVNNVALSIKLGPNVDNLSNLKRNYVSRPLFGKLQYWSHPQWHLEPVAEHSTFKKFSEF